MDVSALASKFFPEKNFLYFFLNKSYSEEISFIFSEKEFYLIFREMELSIHKIKKFQEGTFRAQEIKKSYSEKFSYISGNETF